MDGGGAVAFSVHLVSPVSSSHHHQYAAAHPIQATDSAIQWEHLSPREGGAIERQFGQSARLFQPSGCVCPGGREDATRNQDRRLRSSLFSHREPEAAEEPQKIGNRGTSPPGTLDWQEEPHRTSREGSRPWPGARRPSPVGLHQEDTWSSLCATGTSGSQLKDCCHSSLQAAPLCMKSTSGQEPTASLAVREKVCHLLFGTGTKLRQIKSLFIGTGTIGATGTLVIGTGTMHTSPNHGLVLLTLKPAVVLTPKAISLDPSPGVASEGVREETPCELCTSGSGLPNPSDTTAGGPKTRHDRCPDGLSGEGGAELQPRSDESVARGGRPVGGGGAGDPPLGAASPRVNFPECSRTFENIREHSEAFENIREHSGTFKNTPKDIGCRFGAPGIRIKAKKPLFENGPSEVRTPTLPLTNQETNHSTTAA